MVEKSGSEEMEENPHPAFWLGYNKSCNEWDENIWFQVKSTALFVRIWCFLSAIKIAKSVY